MHQLLRRNWAGKTDIVNLEEDMAHHKKPFFLLMSTKCPEAEVLQFIQSLCEFHLVVGQWSYSEYTLNLLHELLQKFYGSKSAVWSQRSTNVRNVRFQSL
jgi:hypothetical protein